MGAAVTTSVMFLGIADLIARAIQCRGRSRDTGWSRLGDWLTVYGGAFLVTGSLMSTRIAGPPPGAGLIGIAAAAVLSAVVCRRPVRFLHQRGYLSLVTSAQFRLAVVVWLGYLTLTEHVGLPIRVPLAILAVLAVIVVPILVVDGFLLQEAACRDGWEAGETRPAAGIPYRPRVSIHVPCYAEPPDIVAATLDALSRLEYDDFEVIVVDNNTRDEALWHPVREHCRALGDRFRFFHVDPLSGAKAGALNFALARTAPGTELIAVVDADYQAEPDFLADLVGAFADERLGFVQTSHDYRDWAGNPYLTGCYWEYRAMYGGYMRSRSLRESALTTGTMCVVRRRALERVGGWAEWCCTEDSELSVRLHAAGYTGRYVHRTYGRGLVPEEFVTYKRQRYRWIYGPTQEFRRHWRLYLPARWATPSALTPTQKFLFAHHGIRELAVAGASLVTTAAVVALTVGFAAGAAGPPVPAGVVVGLAAGTASGMLVLWPLLRRVVGGSRAQTCRALLCRMALFDARLAAGMAGWRTSSGAFLRTNKFPATSNVVKAISSTARETTRGLAALALATWALVANPTAGLVLPLAGYLTVRAACWLAAPFLALLGNHSLGDRPVGPPTSGNVTARARPSSARGTPRCRVPAAVPTARGSRRRQA